MARPSLRFACGQDFLALAEKRYRTGRHGKGLDMRIQLESACEVAGRILEGEFINGVLSFVM